MDRVERCMNFMTGELISYGIKIKKDYGGGKGLAYELAYTRAK